MSFLFRQFPRTCCVVTIKLQEHLLKLLDIFVTKSMPAYVLIVLFYFALWQIKYSQMLSIRMMRSNIFRNTIGNVGTISSRNCATKTDYIDILIELTSSLK